MEKLPSPEIYFYLEAQGLRHKRVRILVLGSDSNGLIRIPKVLDARISTWFNGDAFASHTVAVQRPQELCDCRCGYGICHTGI